jgi:hypothetical protein
MRMLLQKLLDWPLIIGITYYILKFVYICF